MDAHLLGQVPVLEVRRVVDPRRQQHDRGLRDARSGQPAQVAQEVGAVALDREDVVADEQLGQDPFQDLAVGEHVRDARRRPQVVLQHVELAPAVPDQVDAGHVAADASRHGEADQFAHEARRREHDVAGDNALAQDPLLAVDVLQEEVERGHPLPEAPLQVRPLAAVDDAWDQVEREELLDPAVVLVDRERDANVAERGLGAALAAPQLGVAQRLEPRVDAAVGTARPLGRDQHLIERLTPRRDVRRDGACHFAQFTRRRLRPLRVDNTDGGRFSRVVRTKHVAAAAAYRRPGSE